MSEYRTAQKDGLRARVGGIWTQEKLHYLRKYTEAFMIAMAPKRAEGKWDQLVFIDPLSGPGIDIDRRTNQEFHGSPLIAVNAEPAFDRIYLGDLDAQNVEPLRARIGPVGERVSLDVADCHHRARDIVQSLNQRTLGLAFLDPEGFEVHFAMFETLAKRPIDIVFLFPSGIGIARNLARFVRENHSDLDDLWGSREWRQLPMAQLAAGTSPTAEPGDGYYRSWAAAFCERVATLGYVNYHIERPLRNEQNTPMYHLLFFSKNPIGLTIWRKVQQIDPRGQRQLRF